LAEESATEDGESLLSWLFLSREIFTGFMNELVHGHLWKKNADGCYIQIRDG
jgi:hypothetical protein